MLVHNTVENTIPLCYTKIMKEEICMLLASISTIIVWLFGGIDIAMQCLLVAIAIDYISGLIKAFTTQTLDSKIGLRGIIKKVGLLCIVALAVIVDRITGESGAIRTLVIYYFVANEGLSIIENLGVAGLPIPSSIKKALRAIKKENQ